MARELTVAQQSGSKMMDLVHSLQGGYEVERQVTRSVLKQADGVPFAVEFESIFTLGAELKNSKMDPAHIANVIDLVTGEYCLLIGNKVMHNELDRAYPDGGYV